MGDHYLPCNSTSYERRTTIVVVWLKLDCTGCIPCIALLNLKPNDQNFEKCRYLINHLLMSRALG